MHLEVKTKKTGFPGIGNYIVKKITDKCQINPIVVTKVPKTLFITFPVQLCKSCKSRTRLAYPYACLHFLAIRK